MANLQDYVEPTDTDVRQALQRAVDSLPSGALLNIDCEYEATSDGGLVTLTKDIVINVLDGCGIRLADTAWNLAESTVGLFRVLVGGVRVTVIGNGYLHGIAPALGNTKRTSRLFSMLPSGPGSSLLVSQTVEAKYWSVLVDSKGDDNADVTILCDVDCGRTVVTGSNILAGRVCRHEWSGTWQINPLPIGVLPASADVSLTLPTISETLVDMLVAIDVTPSSTSIALGEDVVPKADYILLDIPDHQLIVTTGPGGELIVSEAGGGHTYVGAGLDVHAHDLTIIDPFDERYGIRIGGRGEQDPRSVKHLERVTVTGNGKPLRIYCDGEKKIIDCEFSGSEALSVTGDGLCLFVRPKMRGKAWFSDHGGTSNYLIEDIDCDITYSDCIRFDNEYSFARFVEGSVSCEDPSALKGATFRTNKASQTIITERVTYPETFTHSRIGRHDAGTRISIDDDIHSSWEPMKPRALHGDLTVDVKGDASLKTEVGLGSPGNISTLIDRGTS